MAVIETVRPHTQALTTLARMWSELKITAAEEPRDSHINELILEASAMIMKEIGYPLFRARVTETVVGAGRSELLLSRTPIVRVNSVTKDGAPLASGEYSVDPESGTLLHSTGWPNTRHLGVWIESYERPDLGKHAITIDYWGGVLGPEDDVLASGISVDGSAESFAVDDPPLLVPGDVIETVGFGEADNNGKFTVVSRSNSDIVVDGDLTSETAPSGARIKVRTLDRALERFCVQTIKSWILGSDRDPSVTSERIGDWSASYGNSDAELAHELPPGVLKGLDRFRRYV